MKEIIDAHFLENYKDYERVCRYCFNNRYLWEDLLQETYLKFHHVRPEVIQRFHEQGRLNQIGYIIIRSLNQGRTRAKKNVNGNTSPLFEISSYECNEGQIKDESVFNSFELELQELEIKENYDKAIKVFDKALSEPVTDNKKTSNFLMIKTFLAVQESNIYQISKQTGINRKYITDVYNEAREFIKKEIA